MTTFEKKKILTAANWLICELLDCEDREFADMVVDAVRSGDLFSDIEITALSVCGGGSIYDKQTNA